jgi:acetyltransferase-like isoleucine patch superfamily enzyme
MSIVLGKDSYHCGAEVRGTLSQVIVGKYCSIAAGVVFDCGFSHEVKNVTTYPMHRLFAHAPTNVVSRGDTFIGNDVYIGESALIFSGVNIGDGAVVGAHAVVKRDVSPYEIVGGVPARSIGLRFKHHQVEKLLKIKWWDWEDEKIRQNLHLLMANDIEEFVNLHTPLL